MESFKPPADRQNPVFFQTPQDRELAKVYKTLLRRIHNSEAEPLEQTCYEARAEWLAAMAEACNRQVIDMAYELAYYKRHLRSRHWRQRLKAEEFLSFQAEVLTEMDWEFGELFERHRQLQAELDCLLGRHAIEMHPVEIAARGFCSEMAHRLGRELRFIFPSRPTGR